MSRIPNVLSPRMKAEHLYSILLNYQVRLDQLDRLQTIKGDDDNEPCGQPREDGEGQYTYGELRADLQQHLETAAAQDRDLLPMMEGVAAVNHRRDERHEQLQELKEEKELKELQLETKRLQDELDGNPSPAAEPPASGNRQQRRQAARRRH